MISDRKHRIEICAAALLLVWLSSKPSLAEDTAVHHIRPSPFQTHGAAGLAPPPKSATDACESLRNLREKSGVYRDKFDCVAVPFDTTDLNIAAEKRSDTQDKLKALQAAGTSPGTGAPSGGTSTTSSAGYWPSFLECKNKGKVSIVAGLSYKTFRDSNLMTEERAQMLVRGAGANDYFTAMASPRVARVARSGPWRIGWFAVTLATSAIAGYEWFFCE